MTPEEQLKIDQVSQAIGVEYHVGQDWGPTGVIMSIDGEIVRIIPARRNGTYAFELHEIAPL